VSRRKQSRKGRGKDPHFEREARKYDNPIPSREFIMALIDEQGCPISFKELAAALEVTEEQIEPLSRRVKAMTRDGQLVRNRRGGYCVVNKEDMIPGRVIGHPDGFGFLKPDEGGEDLFLLPREMRKVWHGDRVVTQVSGMDRRGRREGAVIEVLERAYSSVVGRLHIEKGVAFVVPDNKRITHQILVPPDGMKGATDGQMVVVEIEEHPSEWRQPIGRVVDVLGDHMAPGMETDVAIRAHDIPVEWPQALLEQIADLGEEVPEAAKEGRVDLRDTPLVTIDGEDARDFDDAVYCQPTNKGWRLLVAIADVSSYVAPGTPLDEEAYKRGTSVYFPDRVVPMLPEVLSNGLCSLNPRVDRLCMVAELYFDAAGKLYRSRFFEAVMNSHARLTYDKVWAMLQGDAALREEYAALLPHLENLHALYKVLHAARVERGAIDFDSVETKFRFDENGKVAEVIPLVRHDAHRMIEECMLAANVAAARHLLRKKMPALFRNHERPSDEKLEDLQAFLHELGLSLGGMPKPTAKDYAELLEQAAGRPDYHLIQTVLLRSMMQAVYSAENQGHFGLALPAYAHFTSPIRRYPDLMVHRAIRHLLKGGTPDDFPYTQSRLVAMGEHCSAVERRADEASRDSADALKCEFMLDKVGLDFSGTIVSVNSFGLFVELDDIYITGLVHITALDRDYFHFDPIGHRLTGERSGKVYRLGDKLGVRVAAVNMDERKIDFVLAGAPEGAGEARAPKGKGGRNRKPRTEREASRQKAGPTRQDGHAWVAESEPDANGRTMRWQWVDDKPPSRASKKAASKGGRKRGGRSRARRKSRS
jgi:ribonuclease R